MPGTRVGGTGASPVDAGNIRLSRIQRSTPLISRSDSGSRPRSVPVLSTSEQATTLFTAEAVAALGGPDWLAKQRAEAFERFGATPLPTVAEDLWQYSRIADLDLGDFGPVPAADTNADGGEAELPATASELLSLVPDRSGLVLTLNGALQSAVLSAGAADKGVTLGPISEHPGAAGLLGSVTAQFPGETDAYGALADAFMADGVALTVPKNAELAEPIVIIHVLGGADAAVFPRTLIRLDDNAEATVIELLVSGEGRLLVMPTTELAAADGARLTHNLVQQLGREAWQLGRLFAAAGRDATLHSFQASLGADMARSRTASIITGQGGTAQLLAAYFGDGNQMHDFRILQEHAAPRTTSDLVFKGAVAGTSRSVYTGLIRMRHGSKGANAFQTNRNLVLSDGAHADSVPNLDIQENDVRCSHASAIGPVDAEQRFYLESRGIGREVAERLILLGFYAELLERVTPAVRSIVIQSIVGRAEAATSAAAAGGAT